MRFAGIVGVLLIGGCVRTAAVPCSDGTVCAPGTVCNVEHGQCLTPDQLESCIGKTDGELCSIGTETGICEDELCLAVVCGDGVTQGIEQCDGAPPQTSCFDLGYDAGFLRCNEDVCAADLRACHHVGWKPVAAPSTGSVFRMASADGVGFAVRGSLALRFRAGVWEPIPLPTTTHVFSIHAIAADNVWAVTEDGVFRFDGVAWSRELPQVETISRGLVTAAAPDDVYLFLSPTIGPRVAMHFDGTAWASIALPASFVGMGWAGPAGTFISDGSSVEKLVGGAWQPVVQPLTSIHQLTGVGATVILSGTIDMRTAEVVIGDGTTWARHDITNELGWTGTAVMIGGRAPDDLYAVEQTQVRVVRFDGQRWLRDATLPAPALLVHPIGMQMFAGTTDGFARESPSAFAEIANTLPGTPTMTSDSWPFAAWGRSCEDTFVAASGVSDASSSQIFHFDGTSWTTELDMPATTLTAISGSANETYATTYDRTLLRRSSSAWVRTADEPFPTPLRDISVASDGTIAMWGDSDWLHVFDGSWHSQQLASMFPSDVLALSRDEVYAVTRSGVLHWDGASWIAEPVAVQSHARALWGIANGSLVVVGANGQAWHREQGAWRSESMPFDEYLSVHGSSADDVFAIGATGTLAHFDGEVWAPLRHRLGSGRSVWSGASCTYFVAGSGAASVARLRRGEPW